MYTMGRPVRTCSSPSSAMISVPEAATLPRTSLPTASSNGRMTSGGNPSGYVGNGSSKTTPVTSQWPVVLSLPADRSVSLPCAVPGSSLRDKSFHGSHGAQSERRQGRGIQPGHRVGDVAQCVRPGVPVRGCVGRRAHTERVADHEHHAVHATICRHASPRISHVDVCRAPPSPSRRDRGPETGVPAGAP